MADSAAGGNNFQTVELTSIEAAKVPDIVPTDAHSGSGGYRRTRRRRRKIRGVCRNSQLIRVENGRGSTATALRSVARTIVAQTDRIAVGVVATICITVAAETRATRVFPKP